MITSSSHFDCAIIGNWHLAFVTAAGLARLGHRVALVDPVSNGGAQEFPEPPVQEPELPETLLQARTQGLLEFRDGISSGWTADLLWLAIDTPVNQLDEADTSSLEEALTQLKKSHSGRPLVVSSQVPLGFCEKVAANYGFPVAYVPENLRLGKGLETFLRADRTVIGSDDPSMLSLVKNFLKKLETTFLECNLVTSEMVKHATNAFLATSISFANELARVGEYYGVDNQAVGKALKLDKRIGQSAYVVPGLGFAGGTLPRDLRTLQKLGAKAQVPTALVDAVLSVNESTTDALADFARHYHGNLRGKRALIVGYAYKAETDTLRRSLSIELARELGEEGVEVWGYDPPMNERDLSQLEGVMHHCARWQDVPSDLDLIIVMTPRREFADIDWSTLLFNDRKQRGGHPPLLMDARAIVPKEAVLRANLAYKALWQPVEAGLEQRTDETKL